MMKKGLIILSLFIGNVVFAEANNIKIKVLLNNYITNIIGYSENPNNIRFQHNLYKVVTSIDINHDNDFLAYKRISTFRNYLTVIGNNTKNEISIDIVAPTILNCTNKRYSKIYRYATIKKILRVKGKNHINDYLVAIDVSNPDYKIDALYILTPDIEKEYLFECVEESSKISFAKQFKENEFKLAAADDLYRKGKYKRALTLYDDVEKIDSTNLKAIQGVRDCKKLIQQIDYKEEITYLIEKTRFDEAINAIKYAEDNNILFDSNWIKNAKTRCKRGNDKKYRDYLERLANDYCNKGFYLKAKKVYETLLERNPDYPAYVIALEECEKRDSNYARNQIQKAYNVTRKRSLREKEIVAVFLVYYKYEDTNLLEGKHYDFMTRALISKRSRLKRELKVSNRLAKKLLGKYYYITKKKGINNSELEDLIPDKIKDSYAY